MAETIIPQVWQDFLTNEIVYTNNVISQGMVKINPVAKIGDVRIRKPILKSLGSLTADTVRSAGASLTTQALTDYSQLFPVLARWKGVYSYGITSELKNDDALAKLIPQIAESMNLDIQTAIVNLINGAFTTALATSHTYDVSGAGGSGAFSYDAVSTAGATKLGEAMTNLTGIIMHSKVYNDALLLGMVQFINGVYGQNMLATGQIPTIFGLKVWVNDTLCAGTTANGLTTYPSYLVGGQPIELTWQKKLTMENYREPLGDKNHVIWHFTYGIGIDGVSYTDAQDNPTNAQLASGTYSKVAENDKNIKLVKLITT